MASLKKLLPGRHLPSQDVLNENFDYLYQLILAGGGGGGGGGGGSLVGAATIVATGTTQATAAPLTSDINTFTTVGAGSGCLLVSTGTRNKLTVLNRSGQALTVWPSVGTRIEAGAFNAGVTISAGGAATFVLPATTTTWRVF